MVSQQISKYEKSVWIMMIYVVKLTFFWHFFLTLKSYVKLREKAKLSHSATELKLRQFNAMQCLKFVGLYIIWCFVQNLLGDYVSNTHLAKKSQLYVEP